MQAAVSYGLIFQTDPMAFLDRPERDLNVLLALIHAADERNRKAQKEVERG